MPKDISNKETMNPEDEAMIENPGLPSMGEIPEVVGQAQKNLPTMDPDAQPEKGRKGAKDGMPTPSKTKPRREPSDQKAARAPARPAEKYLRLRLRLNEGEMSVQEVSEVEGPLLNRHPSRGLCLRRHVR